MGDFNSHLNGEKFQKHLDKRSFCLQQLLNTNSYVSANVLPECTGAPTTFLSYSMTSHSLIDHILIPNDFIDLIKISHIMDDESLNVSNHRPVLLSMNFPSSFKVREEESLLRLKWKNINISQVKKYTEIVTERLQQSSILCDINDENYRTVLSNAYDQICNLLREVSGSVFKRSKFKKHLKPFWNDELKSLHQAMREERQKWKVNGQPRAVIHPSFYHYKEAKRLFRRKHRFYAEQYLSSLNEEFDKSADVDPETFWKLYNKRTVKTTSQVYHGSMNFNSSTYRCPKEIARQWGFYFKDLYKSKSETNDNSTFTAEIELAVNRIKNTHRDSDTERFDIDDIKNAISSLNKNKACSHDSVYNEHIIYGGTVFHQFLLRFYNWMYHYSYMPKKLKYGIIITLHKGGRKKKSDPNNYRAIALSSAILKVYELLLLNEVKSQMTVKPIAIWFPKRY